MSGQLTEYGDEMRVVIVEVDSGEKFWVIAQSYADALRPVEALAPGELILSGDAVHVWTLDAGAPVRVYHDHLPPGWLPAGLSAETEEGEAYTELTAASWAAFYYPSIRPYLLASGS